MVKTANFNEYLDNLAEAKITDFNNPNCSNCNECCSMTTMLTDEDYNRLKKFLKTDKKGKELYKQAINKLNRYSQQGTLYLMCPFSNSNKHCSIYNIRPQICKDFHCTESLRAEGYKRPEGLNTTIYDLFKKGWLIKK